MVATLRSSLVVVLLTLAAAAPSGAVPTAGPDGGLLGGLPLAFEPNLGQADPAARFLARGPGYTLLLGDGEAVLRLRGGDDGAAVLRMRLAGARAPRQVEAADPLPGVSHHYAGADPRRWRTDVPQYGRVRMAGVYPGVDVVYYGRGRQLEYDFVVAPGADPGAIGMRFPGAAQPRVDDSGDLLLAVGARTVTLARPVAYQDGGGGRRPVAAAYAVGADGLVGIALGAYDRRLPLVVDPVLVYSSFFGGNADDDVRRVGVDAAGNLYLTGSTESTGFPNAFDPAPEGPAATYVAKINAAGTAVLYGTYLDGRDLDTPVDIEVDAGGNAFVVGQTSSNDFPTTAGAFQTRFDPGFNYPNPVPLDAFVVRLASSGAMVYSTFLGGGDWDSADGIAVDASGRAHVTGFTFSNNFPLRNAFDGNRDWRSDLFYTVLAADGGSLAYSSYFGGSHHDAGKGVALGPNGHAYVVGDSESNDFPVRAAPGASRIFRSANAGRHDAVVLEIDPAAAGSASLVYATYLGGSGTETGAAIAVDALGAAYVTGVTGSLDFPLAAPPGGTVADGSNSVNEAYVAKLDPLAESLELATFLGGANTEEGLDLAVDTAANVYVVGQTTSADFPRSNTLQPGLRGPRDAFVTKLDSLTGRILWSTHFGGNSEDSGRAVVVDGRGNVYLGGATASSASLPRVGAVQNGFGGGGTDGFVAKLATTAADTIGVFRGGDGRFFLRNSNTSGVADVTVAFGQAGDLPVAGDWNGRGADLPGVFRSGVFLLRVAGNTVTHAFPTAVSVAFGQAGDLPVAGDWDGDGVDTIGVFRDGLFLLRNSNAAGAADLSFFLGGAGDVPVAGDWDGDGDDTVGLFRPSTGQFFLDLDNDGGVADVALGFGTAGDLPVVGDWDGDGIDTIAVLRGATFLLRNRNTTGPASLAFVFGAFGDRPVAGDWDARP